MPTAKEAELRTAYKKSQEDLRRLQADRDGAQVNKEAQAKTFDQANRLLRAAQHERGATEAAKGVHRRPYLEAARASLARVAQKPVKAQKV